jgi:hypothetical protein
LATCHAELRILSGSLSGTAFKSPPRMLGMSGLAFANSTSILADAARSLAPALSKWVEKNRSGPTFPDASRHSSSASRTARSSKPRV